MTQTWTANVDDDCGNSAVPVSVTYTWVEDTEPPMLINPAISCASLDLTNLTQCLSVAETFDATTLYDQVKSLYDDNCDNDLMSIGPVLYQVWVIRIVIGLSLMSI